LNLVVRRRGAENNFKAVLEKIRGLMIGMGSIDRVIPPWLQKVILGHGDPSSASYGSEAMKLYAEKTVGVAKPGDPLDFGDTFVSKSHLRESFPGCDVLVDGNNESTGEDIRRNYRVRFQDGENGTTVHAMSYAFAVTHAGNSVPFTPVQVSAIRSGLSPGLSVVVGPPGTGSKSERLTHSFCFDMPPNHFAFIPQRLTLPFKSLRVYTTPFRPNAPSSSRTLTLHLMIFLRKSLLEVMWTSATCFVSALVSAICKLIQRMTLQRLEG
jgi:hypothetical protein